jgi:hypothetical protein
MKTTRNTVRAYGKSALSTLVMVTGTALVMAACSTVATPPKAYSQDLLPENIRVPADHQVVLETTAVGVLNYECKANVPTAGTIGWVLTSPKADLLDRTGKNIASYTGPPATWRHADGSAVIGSQIAIAPQLGGTNIPLQLSSGRGMAGPGVLQNVAYIQRIKTKGGQDFSKACTQADIGDKLTLPYQADYIFWKAV